MQTNTVHADFEFGSSADSCRRRAKRVGAHESVRFEPQGALGAVPRRATLLDASASGLCLLCDAVCAPGDRLVVHLPYRPAGGAEPEQADVSTVLCTVRTCRVRADGLFRVGVELMEVSWEQGGGPALAQSADGITGWVGCFIKGRRSGGATRAPRHSERRGADGRATIYTFKRKEPQPAETVGVVDLSAGGVAILRRAALSVGDHFVARVPREGAAPLTRLCRVTAVTPAGRQYRIGARFVRSPAGFGRGWLGKLLDWIA